MTSYNCVRVHYIPWNMHTHSCCTLSCCGYIMFHGGFMSRIHPYASISDPMPVKQSGRMRTIEYTVRCRFNAVNYLTNIHKRHPIARPTGRGMGCVLWIRHLIDILPQFLQIYMQCLTKLDRVITALICTLYSTNTWGPFYSNLD